jgi:transcriptional regulator with XRE-family HTH domain
VQTWEAGERLPRAETLQRIAMVLGQPVSWFYTEPERAAA